MPELVLADAAERDDLGAFAARAVRLDGQSVVRLRNRNEELLDAWVATIPLDGRLAAEDGFPGRGRRGAGDRDRRVAADRREVRRGGPAPALDAAADRLTCRHPVLPLIV